MTMQDCNVKKYNSQMGCSVISCGKIPAAKVLFDTDELDLWAK